MVLKTISENNEIKILLDPYEVMHEVMSGEQRHLLIQSLSCADDVIEYVIQQVLYGCTDDGYCGFICSDMNTAIQQARKQIAENSDNAVKQTIMDLENQIKSQSAMIDFLNSQIEKLKCDR